MIEYRLWINRAGDPLYVECLGRDLNPEAVKHISEYLAQIKETHPVILSKEWEVRVLA